MRRRRVFATLKVIRMVLEQLTEEVSPDDAERSIPEEVGSLFLCICFSYDIKIMLKPSKM